MGFRWDRRIWGSLATSLVLAGCGGGGSSNGSDGSGANPSSSPEPSYCSTTHSYSPSVTVTATAQYQYRALDFSHGLYGNPVTTNIPYAEVAVYDANNNLIQCSTTSASGAISLTVPRGAASYTLKVFSRSDTTKVKISVLEDYYENAPYSISQSFSVAANDTSVSAGTLLARARVSEAPKIEGGAFHIMDMIYRANEYIRTTTGNTSFVAPKVSVYWKMGFNPYTYFGGTDPLSFYRPGSGELFILGGDQGDVKNSDTDHFDDSVIVHEYGHFLEDKFAQSDSPGGRHTGNSIIDPRLAWSEGWANFLQGAVLHSGNSSWKYYIDTVGFSGDSVEGGSGAVQIKFDLSISGSDGSCYAGSVSMCDRVSSAGEGTFREVSISRFLYKTVVSTADGGVGVPFSNVWLAFTGSDSGGSAIGIASPHVNFRNIGTFNQFLRAFISTNNSSLLSSWDTLRSDEQQNADARNYADTLSHVASNSCAQKSITPVVDSNTSTGAKSNQYRSNAFYVFDHDGSAKTISLVYTGGSSGSPYNDLDLFLYQDGYVYQETNASSTGGVVRSSSRLYATDLGTETIDLTGLAAGRYLINVKAYTYGKTSGQLGGTMNYRLKITQGSTTEDLCPAH